MPLSTYQNDSTCDLGAPLRPYSERTPHAAAPRKAVAAGSFRVSAGEGGGERNGVANGFVMKQVLLLSGLHNRLLRRQHCSSLCSQSEGHEHVANMTNALGHDFVGFSVLVRHNIRPPHFASKVSYSASPQASAKCPRGAPCSYAYPRCALQVIYSRPQVMLLAAEGSSTRGRR